MDECDYTDNTIKGYKNQFIPLLCILSLATILVILLTIKFFKNRNQFPIKERSPLLSVASLLSLYVSFIKYLIPLLIYSVEKSQEQQNSNIRFKTFILFFFGGVGFGNFLFCQLIKQLRLIIAVKCKYINNGILNLFKSEVFLIKISLLLSISYACFMETWRLYQNYEQICVKNSQIYYVYDYDLLIEEALTSPSLFVCLSLQVYFIFSAFTLRNLRSEYNLQREYIQMNIFLFLIQIYSILDLNIESAQYRQIIFYYATWIIFLVFIVISYVLPLLKCRTQHQMLTTSKILQEFELFIQEDYCVDAFEKFISQQNFPLDIQVTSLNSNTETPDTAYQTQGSKEVLNFYFHVKQHLMQNQQEIDTQFASQTINQFKNKPLNLFEYLSQIENLPKLKSPSNSIEEEAMFQNNQPRDVLLLYFTFAREFLQRVYKQYYSQTISFHMIKRILYFNERVNKNLEKLKMIDKNATYQI